MDFKQIEAFVNVIKYKGFSKAAEATYITQPTISAHINALEKELNIQLIDRKRRETALTPEGKLFYSYAITLLNTRERAVHTLQNYALNINGIIDIQSSVIPGCYLLPKYIAGFKKKYPLAKFNITLSDSSGVVEQLKERKGELGFTGRRETNSLCYELLEEDNAVLIAPDDGSFPFEDGAKVKLKDIVKMPFVVRENGSATLENFCTELDHQGIPLSSLNIVLRVNSIDAIRQAVRTGIGVSIISGISSERDQKNRGYRVCDIEDYSIQRRFYLVFDNAFTMSPTAETFKSYVLEQGAFDLKGKGG